MEIWEYALFLGAGYWVMIKARDYKDDGAKRAIIGVGAGILAGWKGPEIYEKFTNLKNSPDGAETKDRLIAAAIGAGAGYVFGPKIIGSAKKMYGKIEGK
ncbi:MAG: hypothetical protein ACP5N2_03330 [Candidatus Nanoarchaeia archaeon]